MVSIIAVIIITGLIGGYAGYLANVVPANTSGNATPTPQTALTTDLTIGVVAAACVPALLKLTNTDLAKEIFVDKPAQYDLLFLAGLCLVAAYAARTFLNSLSSQILKQQVANLQQTASHLSAKVDNVDQKLDGVSTAMAAKQVVAVAPVKPNPLG